MFMRAACLLPRSNSSKVVGVNAQLDLTKKQNVALKVCSLVFNCPGVVTRVSFSEGAVDFCVGTFCAAVLQRVGLVCQ